MPFNFSQSLLCDSPVASRQHVQSHPCDQLTASCQHVQSHDASCQLSTLAYHDSLHVACIFSDSISLVSMPCRCLCHFHLVPVRFLLCHDLTALACIIHAIGLSLLSFGLSLLYSLAQSDHLAQGGPTPCPLLCSARFHLLARPCMVQLALSMSQQCCLTLSLCAHVFQCGCNEPHCAIFSKANPGPQLGLLSHSYAQHTGLVLCWPDLWLLSPVKHETMHELEGSDKPLKAFGGPFNFSKQKGFS